MTTEIVARVPAKVMLAGEYAVLAGGRALAATLDAWLTARLTLRAEPGLVVRSNLWPSPQLVTPGEPPEHVRGTPLLHAVAAAARATGIDGATVAIDSAIDVSHGIGSSSALRLAVSLAFAKAAERAGRPLADKTRGPARLAVSLQREAQGGASGYDVATQLVGGLVSFVGADDLALWPGRVHAFEGAALGRLGELVRVYVGGEGSPTGPLLKSTRAWLSAEGHWDEFKARSEKLAGAIVEAVTAPPSDDATSRLVKSAAQHRALLKHAPGFPKAVEQALADVPGEGERWTWKTTGAGGDDAILVIGPEHELDPIDEALRAVGRRPLAIMFTPRGAEVTAGEARKAPPAPTERAL